MKLLSRNPHIGILSLSPSVACTCTRTKRLAQSMVEISGPTGCVAALVEGSPVTRITAIYTALSQSHIKLFAAMTLSPQNFVFLHLDFSNGDVNILNELAASAPFLQTLELDEKKLSRGSQVCPISFHIICYDQLNGYHHQLRYPWGDTVRWAMGLRKLGYLSRFSLRTCAPLVQRPGNQADERRVVANWTGVTAQLPQQLNFIVLWYLWGQPTNQRSCWSRGHKKWIRESSQINPNSTF